ncbi:MAG TPA: glycosyl hydrolase, partial [Gemmatimonadaceae bacterium]|nr:glycosyl hydrolase [Gemmatimonadaceae bacterium]
GATGGRGGGGGRGGFGGAQRVGNRVGFNRYTWNLQYPDASTFQGMILWQGSTAGPFVAPGTYTARLTVGSAPPLTEKFVVKKDPLTSAMVADLVEQQRFALQLRDRVSAANDAVKTIRNVRRQLDDRAPKMSSNAGFGTMVKTFEDQLANVEDSLYQTKNRSGEDPLNFPVRINNQMAALLGFVASGERRPPKQSYDVFAVLDPKLQTELARYKRVMDANLAKINAALKAAGQAEIVPSTAEPPGAVRADNISER